MYVVIVLETDSDFPGVVEVYGPFERELAEQYADEIAERFKVKRGQHVQVAQCISIASAC